VESHVCGTRDTVITIPYDPPAFTIERQMIVQRSLAQEPRGIAPGSVSTLFQQTDLALAPYNNLLLAPALR